MSKFNQTQTRKTVNKSKHIAYDMHDKDKLVTQVLCSFFKEPKYYGDTTNEMVELAETIAKKEPRFISNLARYSRKEFHLRSVSHALTCVVAHEVNSKKYIKETVNDVVERPDDILEILSCYLSMYGKPIPNGLKKALGNALKRFNEFNISKYNGGNKAVKFKDVLRLTHVKPSNEREQLLFNKIMTDTLPIAKRWETELSTKGNNKETWENLIEENRIGYMAGLRNLRNIINAKPRNINKIYDKLQNKDEVLRSKQLPFRFMSAYKEVQNIGTSKVLDVLENAIECSCENLPRLKGKTVIAIDVSGSMTSKISNKSTVKCNEIACLLGVLASRICDEYIVYTFDTSIKNKTFSKRAGIIETAMKINSWGGGTNIKLPLEKMIDEHIEADRLIILSDNEINSNSWGGGYKKTCQHLADQYRRTINKNLWVHAIDLQGYGTQQFLGDKTNIIAGWSERVLEFINLAENGIDTQVKRIEEYHL